MSKTVAQMARMAYMQVKQLCHYRHRELCANCATQKHTGRAGTELAQNRLKAFGLALDRHGYPSSRDRTARWRAGIGLRTKAEERDA